MVPFWKIVTDNRPDTADFPVTVVRSKDRDRAVWTNLIEKLTPEDKASVAPYFEDGEIVAAEDWWPPLA